MAQLNSYQKLRTYHFFLLAQVRDRPQNPRNQQPFLVSGYGLGRQVLQQSVRYDNIIIICLMSEQIETHVLELYQPSKKIGSGAYGHVWKVQQRGSKVAKALKKNFDAFSNSTDAQRTYREIMFLRQLKHPNIISLQRVIPARNDKDIYLVFEHMDIDLHKLIREDGKSTQLQERHKQFIIHQIAKAIFYLHNSNLIHRDLKPSNVLINENCEAKLCDFGLVRLQEEAPDQELVIMTDYIATRWYRAPELLLGSKDYSKEVDIWALGCLIGEMFLGKPMFPGTSTINQLERVLGWTGPPSSQDIKHVNGSHNQGVYQLLNLRRKSNKNEIVAGKVSAGCLDLISRMLEFNPAKRLTIEQVLKHEYLAQFYDQKEMRQIRSNKTKICLHISDNTKLTTKDYRELIYSEVRSDKQPLTSFNSNHCPFSSQQAKSRPEDSKRREINREKSRTKTVVNEPEPGKLNTFQSTQSRDDTRYVRKDIKSSMERSTKSRPQSKKKGISLCSKSMSKNASLKKKRQDSEGTEGHELRKGDLIKRLKGSKSGCEKREKGGTQENMRSSGKAGLLAQCYVNENIGRRFYNHEAK